MVASGATASRVREHKETTNSSSNIDRQQYQQHPHQHQHQHHEHIMSQKQSQQSSKSRLLSSSIATSSTICDQGSTSSSSGNMSSGRRTKISHTRFSHIDQLSPTSPPPSAQHSPLPSHTQQIQHSAPGAPIQTQPTLPLSSSSSSQLLAQVPPSASSVSDVPTGSNVMSQPSLSLPLQDKTDIFHLHHPHHSSASASNDQVHSSTSSMKSQQQQQQHYQMLRGRHKNDDPSSMDRNDYATSSFTNVDDLTNAIRNKVIVEEDEEDILSSDNTYLY